MGRYPHALCAEMNLDSTCRRYSTPFADDGMSTKKGGRGGILPRVCSTSAEQVDCNYRPEGEALAAVVPGAFGTLRYPEAVDLVTLLMTSSRAAWLPPV